ncbi:hypothetical protein M5D96_003802, partial [Drosophila gunungcola]
HIFAALGLQFQVKVHGLDLHCTPAGVVNGIACNLTLSQVGCTFAFIANFQYHTKVLPHFQVTFQLHIELYIFECVIKVVSAKGFAGFFEGLVHGAPFFFGIFWIFVVIDWVSLWMSFSG